MAHAYFVLREAGQPDRVLVWDTRTVSIGRAAGSDLVVNDDEISRKHALLEKRDDRFVVGDYRTGNGTFVNRKRVQQSAEIQAGDIIGIGKLELEFVIAAAHPATLGLKVEYASQLKTVGMLPKGVDGDRTMLSLTEETASEGDEFVIEPERSSGSDAFRAGARDNQNFQVRDLDDSLDSMDLELASSDELGFSDSLEPLNEPPSATPSGDTTRARRPPSASAPAASPASDPTERLRKLKGLLDEGLITDDEYRAKRARILDEM